MFPIDAEIIAALSDDDEDDDEVLSSCCGAPLYEDSDICTECGEHC